MKKIIMIHFCILICLLGFQSKGFAKDSKISIFLNGEPIQFRADPIIRNGTTMIEFRSFFEHLGLQVGWDDVNKVVSGKKAELTIELQISNNLARVNTDTKILEAAPFIQDGITFVPIRLVSEASGFKVEWYGDQHIIQIGDQKDVLYLKAIIEDMRYAVRIKDLWGAVDRTGKVVIPGVSTYPFTFSEGVASITDYRTGKTELIDKQGNVIVKFSYSVGRFNNGAATGKSNSGNLVFDKTGKILVPEGVFDWLYPYKDGLAAAYSNKAKKWGFIDNTGNLAIPLEFDNMSFFSEGLAYEQKGNKQGYIDTNGNFVFETDWQGAEYGEFHEGLAVVSPAERPRRCGFINTSGNVEIGFEFADAQQFSNGLARVKGTETDAYGYINHQGQWVIPPQYTFGGNFIDGYTEVKTKDKVSIINTDGKELLSFPLDTTIINQGYGVFKIYPARDQNKVKLIDVHGNIFWDAEKQ